MIASFSHCDYDKMCDLSSVASENRNVFFYLQNILHLCEIMVDNEFAVTQHDFCAMRWSHTTHQVRINLKSARQKML